MSPVKAKAGRGGSGAALRAVILAGGRGTRFWPVGRSRRPKQFLPIAGPRSMVEETVRRVRPLVPPGRILFVADAGQTRSLRKLFPKMPASSFVVEPLASRTRTCISRFDRTISGASPSGCPIRVTIFSMISGLT